MASRVLGFVIDRTTGVPPYLQIVNQVIDAIHAGQIQRGDYLPPVSQVVRETSINANTVMKAYRELEYLKIASPKQGIGTIITNIPERASDELLNHHRLKFAEVIGKSREDDISWESIQHLFNSVILELKSKEGEDGGN